MIASCQVARPVTNLTGSNGGGSQGPSLEGGSVASRGRGEGRSMISEGELKQRSTR
jgi:hypothetical protein